MVRSLVSRFVSGTALGCLALAALTSPAWPQTPAATSLHFTTAITQVYGSQYPLTGHLDIQIFPGGHLRGYYHTSYYKLFIPVVGGRDGDYIWFDIGPSTIDLGLGAGPDGKLHVVGTMNADGSFRGQVYPETAAQLSGLSMQSSLNNTTSPTANDQYIFAASPTPEAEPTPTVGGPP